MAVELVYCAGGNRRFAEIAVSAGFRYGAQLPATVYFAPWFADQNWKKPDRERYLAAVREHRPEVATVLDWEREDQLTEVLGWAEDVAALVETVIIIPKVVGGVHRLPRTIGGREVRLGYSVPTKFGGTSVPAWEFSGWPVHLLGGSPSSQLQVARYLDIRSADGNLTQKMAVKFGRFWGPNGGSNPRNRHWPQLRETGWDGPDVPYEAFRRSCEHVKTAWRGQIHAL